MNMMEQTQENKIKQSSTGEQIDKMGQSSTGTGTETDEMGQLSTG